MAPALACLVSPKRGTAADDPAAMAIAKGKNMMQSVLMLSLAVSIMLGMWVIWRITP
jgi:hypothetical protein